MKKVISRLLVGAIISTGLLTAQTSNEKLRYVIDGDTVKFAKTTCRLAYIDTPESKNNNKLKRDIGNQSHVSTDEVIKAGRISKNYLKSQMSKGSSYTFKTISKDKYSRSVCVIYEDASYPGTNPL